MGAELSATGNTERLARIVDIRSLSVLAPVIVLLAATLSGCDSKPAAPQAAAAPPPVTVAQPTKRSITDWDEFTGRFDAVEEVQVRARVGGFVTHVEFRDGAFVNAGDLLYIIDPRPFEAGAERGGARRAARRGAAGGEGGADPSRSPAQGGQAQHRIPPCRGSDQRQGQPTS